MYSGFALLMDVHRPVRAERLRHRVRRRQRLAGPARVRRHAAQGHADPVVGAGAGGGRLHRLRRQPSRRAALPLSGRGRGRPARGPLHPAPRQGLRDRSGSARRPRRIVGRTPGRARLHAGRARQSRGSGSGQPRAGHAPDRGAARSAGRSAEDDRGTGRPGPRRVVPRGAAGRQRADVEGALRPGVTADARVREDAADAADARRRRRPGAVLAVGRLRSGAARRRRGDEADHGAGREARRRLRLRAAQTGVAELLQRSREVVRSVPEGPASAARVRTPRRAATCRTRRRARCPTGRRSGSGGRRGS